MSNRNDVDLTAELSDDELAEIMGGWGPPQQQPGRGFGRRSSLNQASPVRGPRPALVGSLAEEPVPPSTGTPPHLDPGLEVVPESSPGGYGWGLKGSHTEPEPEPGSVSPQQLAEFHAQEAEKLAAATDRLVAESIANSQRS